MLNKRLDEVMKETNKTISYCRELVLEEFKNKGIIKNYNYTNNFNPLVNSQKEGYEHCLYFGSKAGFDNMYYVSF